MRCKTPRGCNLGSGPTIRDTLCSLESKKNGVRIGAILCICVVLLLFAAPYIAGEFEYTVYHNIAGYNGDVEKACSIVALLFAIFPVPFLIAKLDVRRRNLPFNMSLVSAGAVGIYSCVIFFGSIDVNAVMLLITAVQALSALLAHRYVKLLEEIENALFHSEL